MVFEQILPFAQIIISVLLIIVILLQKKGGDAGSAFGGGDGAGFYRTKRGLEKGLLNATIVLAVFFVVIGLMNALFHQPAPQIQINEAELPPTLEINEENLPQIPITNVEPILEPVTNDAPSPQ